MTQGAKFVSYQAETGDWKFEVEHFSKYGLLDDSDDEDEATAVPRGKKAPHVLKAAPVPTQRAGDGCAQDMQQGERVLSSLASFPLPKGVRAASAPV